MLGIPKWAAFPSGISLFRARRNTLGSGFTGRARHDGEDDGLARAAAAAAAAAASNRLPEAVREGWTRWRRGAGVERGGIASDARSVASALPRNTPVARVVVWPLSVHEVSGAVLRDGISRK